MKFDCDKLANSLELACPEIIFALLHGSAKDGSIKAGSDLDIALFVDSSPTLDFYQKTYDAISSVIPVVEPDVGILNHAEPVYRFEALKGKLLFCRDKETYLDFFSRTCREYEFQMADYQRQHRYRLEAMKV
jgi:predicted nucleotidyltransferase